MGLPVSSFMILPPLLRAALLDCVKALLKALKASIRIEPVRWRLYVALATKNKDKDADKDHQGRKNLGSPEVNLQLQLGGSDARKRANINRPVEPIKYRLDCNIAVDKNLTAIFLLSTNKRAVASILFSNHRARHWT